MKRAFLIFVASAALALCQEQPAAEHAPQGEHTVNAEAGKGGVEHGAAEQHGDPMIWWKWANFAILAGVLGYMIGKKAPGFFRARTEEIQRDIAEATRLREAAEAKVAEMESRLASLQSEVEKLRTEARSEMEHEGERIRQETARLIAKVQSNTEQEIESMAKHATHELKVYSAKLAIEMAEGRIRGAMSSGVQERLVEQFVRDLDAKGLKN